MGMYEFGIGVGTIIIISILWTIFLKPVSVIEDIAINKTDNSTIKSDVLNQYSINTNVFFWTLFVITIIIVIWIIKISAEQARRM